MLTKAFILVLVMLIGLALGFETARYVHSAGWASTGMVNIHLAVFAGVLLTVMWVSRTWLVRQWTRFTIGLELTLDGLFDFNSLDVGDGLGSVSVHKAVTRGDIVAGHTHTLKQLYSGNIRLEPLPGTPDSEACAQDALDDAAKTTCSGCGKRGHWSPDCPSARPPNAVPCRGCSWCGVDPGDLPDELWTECDGSGFYLPEKERIRRLRLEECKHAARPQPSREGRQPDGSYVIEVGSNETHEDVVRRHPDVLFIQGDVLFKRAGLGPLIVRMKEQ